MTEDAELDPLALEARDLVRAYEACLRAADEERVTRRLWLFRRTPNHEAYEQRVMELVRRARIEGRAEGSPLPPLCSCRCREHGRHVCHRCLVVERCTLHAEPDPLTAQADALLDARAVEAALRVALADRGARINGELRDVLEAIDRVVCAAARNLRPVENA